MSAVDEKRFKALDREWTARFDFNAMCEIEERCGRPFLEIVAPMLQRVDTSSADQASLIGAARAIRMSDIRLLFHQSLLGAHPEVTEIDAGELIAAIGFTEAMGIVAWAVVRGIGSGEGSDAAGAANPPTKATAKTGGRSR